MTRSRADIMRDLHAILAELNYALEVDDLNNTTDRDISPKLAKALDQTLPPTIVGGTRETHEDIRAKARAYKPSDYSAGYDEPGVRRSQRYDEPGIPEKPTDYSDMDRAYKSNDDIRANEVNRSEHKERLKDYTPADDAQWDEAVFLGTGDRQP